VVPPPPTYIFASTRTRREFTARRSGPGRALIVVAALLLAFWAALGVGTAALLGAL
jgi:hypothetical protein